jgi:uroporphyrinogen decarboxylase
VFEAEAEPLAHFFSGAFDSYWGQATPYEAVADHLVPVRPIKRAPADARERLLEAMQLGHPEPVPASWLGGGIWTLNHRGHTFTSLIGRPEDMARALVETFERTGNPIVFVGSGYNIFQLAPFGAKIQFRVVGHLDLAEPLVRDADELDAFDVNALAREPAIQTIWEAARLVAAEIGDETLVAATAWGPFNLAAHILGIETLTRGLYKNPRQVEKAIDFAVRVIKKFYEPLLAEKITPVVSLADTIAGDHVSRAHFTHFVLPYLQDIIRWAKAQDVLVLLHICGALQDKLDLLAETGADCVSLDSRVNLKAAKELFAGKVCVAGYLDPVGVLDHLTAKEVEAAARECLLAGAPGGGFILMPGCDIPPTVPLDNVRAMLRAAEMWR